ncbi:MAG: hypothetical protein M3Y85_09545 [Bacteroidota bacterium]|nr:hypothetical protein [Bacteroidota bacterium]
MKKWLLTTSCFFSFVFSFAQDCKTNLYMTDNAKLVMTIYDKKGAVTGTQNIAITGVKKTGDAYESTITNSFTNDKGKVLSNASGTYHCKNGALSADMKMFMPQEQMGKMGEAEANVEPVYLEYPATPSPGQALKDAEFTMNMKMNGGMGITVNFKEENRKVANKESVTSPAGTWDAYVITYDGTMKTKMAGLGLPGFNFSAKEWFVPGMGVVKTESYNKGGKLVGSTMLTSVTK